MTGVFNANGVPNFDRFLVAQGRARRCIRIIDFSSIPGGLRRSANNSETCVTRQFAGADRVDVDQRATVVHPALGRLR